MSNKIYRVSYVQDYSLNTLYFKANSKAEVQEKFLKQNSNLKESQIVSIESLEGNANSSFDFSNYLKQIASDKAIRAMVIGGLLLTGLYFGSQKYSEYKQQKLIEEFENEHKEISPQEMQQNHNEEYEEEEYEPTPLKQPNQNSKQSRHTELHTKVPNINSQKEKVVNPIKSNLQNPIVLTNNELRLNATYKTIDNRVYFKINAQNVFANAKGGISVSIPALRYDKDIYSISQNGFDSAKIYPAGSLLWSGSLKRKITASYLLIEGWSNKWYRNKQKGLEFSVDKDLIANKIVNIRAVLVKNRKEYVLPKSGATDQQGYHVKQITVNVGNNSNKANSENRQNYESGQSGDKTALKKVLNSWNRAMNNKDTSLLEYLLANKLKYYGTQYSRTKTIKDKQRILKKYPEFSQQIKNISYEEITQNLYKVSFDKYVKTSNVSEEKLYPSYLYIKKINSEWRIIEEGDKVTDHNLLKKNTNITTISTNSYIARISSKDHYNKRGNKLRKVADILQQDRANFYKYGIRDREDTADNYFFKKENRFKIKRMLQNGYISGDTAYQIINGAPLIKVEVNGNSINVSLIRDNNVANKDVSKLDTNTLYKLGKKYWVPARNIEQTERRQKNFIAKKYFKIGCNKGDMRACSMLSSFYYYGWGGAKDYYKAVKYAKLSCNSGNIKGCLEIALAYRKGYGGIKKNMSKALNMYKNMCKKNIKVGCRLYNKFKSNNTKKPYEYTKKSLNAITKIGYLMWQDDGKKVRRNWYGAKKYCENLKLGGYSDWRLPSKNELISLYRNKYKLKHNLDGNYISSYTNTNRFGFTSYWLISFYDGYTTWRDVSNDYDVICVR